METESWANLVLRLDQGLYNGKRNFRIVFLIFEKKILNINVIESKYRHTEFYHKPFLELENIFKNVRQYSLISELGLIDVSRVFLFSRCRNGTFPLRNYSDTTLLSISNYAFNPTPIS